MSESENAILVSVVCTAFNHEKYIRKTLEGFVMQKTNFKFEVIIHDDASTDGTQMIIEEYKRRYPDLFHLIFQKRNIYSQNISSSLYINPLIRGKYIALCEGDDYWTDEEKLQRQVDYMETHPECTLVAHNGIRVDEQGNYISVYSEDSHEEEYDLTLSEIVENLSLFPTAAMMYKKTFIADTAELFKCVPEFDYVYKILLAGQGYVHMIPRSMSAYRMSAEGSWTVRVAKNPEKYAMHLNESIDALTRMDAFFDYKYHDVLQNEVIKRKYTSAEVRHALKELKSSPLKDIYVGKSLRYKFCMNLAYYMPYLYVLIRKLKG